ncbi:MAG: V-type ATPase subunit [Lachnospiraceae bacterium]|nr:V-type ATPase subunit [Lachnospiraceae bacterium]
MADNYVYAVARIRSLEMSLFSNAVIDQLISCKNYDSCLQFLVEKGWGDSDTESDAEAMLSKEHEKTWKIMHELAPDMSVFDVLSYPNLFHNLKAAVKQVVIGKTGADIFYDDCGIDGETMVKIIAEKNYQALPKNMQEAARDAYETFVQTRDGQLCDIIVDQAALKAIYEAGKKADDAILKAYAESTVAVADIKIAVRAQKTGKSIDFMKQAMAECASVSVDKLSHAALNGLEGICSYLDETDYSEGAEALRESPSAFERWCDNRIITTIKPQKYNSFSVGPLVAYILARENEIKTVRIILSGKQNGFSDESIRERVREMYV